MRRREFITLLGGAAAYPIAARAQQPAVPIVGFLGSTSLAGREGHITALRQGLAEIGYVDGRNVGIEFRWADNQYDRLPGMVEDLVRRKVAAIIAFGAVNGVLAAKAATTAIPIVFLIGSDPVGMGLVRSLGRPGGNLTGVALLVRELTAKRLELVREIVPGISTIGFLVNPSNANAEGETQEVREAARSLGLQILVVNANNETGIDAAFTTLDQQRAGAFFTATDAFFTGRSGQIAALAAKHSIQGIAPFREYIDAGGLMSYGANQADAFRLVGNYTGRILKGEKPADLPVQQAAKVELIINLKTAKTLGLAVPLALLTRADEVIE
jgi:putative tryptophan/tyrosine transport system substrate-binding protein